MHQEKYNLTWHSYSDHLKNMMKELMMNEDFADVTLVTEDKKQIKAHINILSSCSPVFKDILKKDKNSSSIVYLRGIQYSELESIMQFIYVGEATFYEERMNEFLAVAKSLEIRELCNAETESNDEPDDDPPPDDQDISTEILEEQTHTSDNIKKQSPQERQRRSVSVNGKYNCDQCHKSYSNRQGLYTHKQSVHQGVKFACDQCDHQYTDQTGLRRHIQSEHEGIKYACDQCDFQAKRQDHLTKHIQSKHEGIRYACDQCDFQATLQRNLTRHIQSKHEGVKYSCNQCDYQATQQGHLNLHIQRKH